MTKKKNAPHPYLIGALIFILGFMAGVGLTVYKMQPLLGQGGQNVATNPATQQQAPGFDHNALHDLEDMVKENPTNLEALIQLAHLYFDSSQLDKAIPAYEKALKIDPKNANLWTDIGVAFRRTSEPQKAIECFEKAIALDAKHEQSRFNKGIVLLYDLGKRQDAIKSFQSVLAINPQAKSSNGGSVAEFVEWLKDDNNKI